MARITVEDCIHAIPNRFDLVLLAAERARALGRGVPSDLPPDRDKRPVIALREIASGTVDPDELRDGVIAMFRHIDVDDSPDTMPDRFEPDTIVVPNRERSCEAKQGDSQGEELGGSEIQEEDASRQDKILHSTDSDWEEIPDEFEGCERELE